MKLRSVLIGVLSVALVAQLVMWHQYRVDAHEHTVAASAGDASWAFYARTLQEARAKAPLIVLARVTAIEQAPDVVIPLQGLPLEEAARQQSQRITLDILRTLQGPRQDTLRLFHLGTDTFSFDGDPPYKLGETYVLFVEPRHEEPGTYLLISPEGRYRIVNNLVEPMVDKGFPATFRGHSLDALVQQLNKLATGQQ